MTLEEILRKSVINSLILGTSFLSCADKKKDPVSTYSESFQIQTELVTEPKEILEAPNKPEENVKIFENTTNDNGQISFIDPTSEDGVATIKIVDKKNEPIQTQMEVTYYDHQEFKVFTAIDPNPNQEKNLLPTMGLFTHNSPHNLYTDYSKNGTIHIQTIKEEDELKAFYKWENFLGNWTKWEYEDTIDETERIKRKNKNSTIVSLIDLTYTSFLGTELPVSFKDLSKVFDPYRDKTESKRWDVYRVSTGSNFAKELEGDVVLIPSNIPTIEINEPEISGNTAIFTWESRDKTEYDFPYELPERKDATVLLGPTKESDLKFYYELKKESETIQSGSTLENSMTFETLLSGGYEFKIEVEDEVENTLTKQNIFTIDSPIDLEDKIVFLSLHGGNLKAYTTQPEWTNPIEIANFKEIKNIKEYIGGEISPNKKLALVKGLSSSDTNIFAVLNLEKSIIEYSGEGKSLQYSSWSPNSEKIIIGDRSRKNGESHITNFMWSINGMEKIDNDLIFIDQMDWYMDSESILFSTQISKEQYLFKTKDRTSEGKKIIFKEKMDDSWFTFPTLSPDNSKIALFFEPLHRLDFVTIDKNGAYIKKTENFRVGGRPYIRKKPKWSSDGMKIVFIGSRNIYTIDEDGTNLTNLTKDTAWYTRNKYQASWSPNEEKIVFSENVSGGKSDIFIINSDGSDKINITKGYRAFNFSPTW